MKTDEEIINSAFKKACKELDLKLNYKEQADKIIFLRAVQALDTLNGGDYELMKHWMNTYNNHLMFTPSQMIGSNDNLYMIVNYLEGFYH